MSTGLNLTPVISVAVHPPAPVALLQVQAVPVLLRVVRGQVPAITTQSVSVTAVVTLSPIKAVPISVSPVRTTGAAIVNPASMPEFGWQPPAAVQGLLQAPRLVLRLAAHPQVPLQAALPVRRLAALVAAVMVCRYGVAAVFTPAAIRCSRVAINSPPIGGLRATAPSKTLASGRFGLIMEAVSEGHTRCLFMYLE